MTSPDVIVNPDALNSRLPNVARIYDFLLGGKDNYAADRAAALKLIQAVPDAARAAKDNRAFLSRAVKYLTAERGISQIIDIGTGLPTRGAVHEIAQASNPATRVVYADNDPVVVAHSRMLISGARNVAAVNGDVRHPGHLLTQRDVQSLIDFDLPTAVLLVAVLHFVPDDEDPWTAVKTVMDSLAPGSFLVVSHVTSDQMPDDAAQRASEIYTTALVRGQARSRADIQRFFGNLEMAEPGLVDVAEWRSGRRAPTIGRPVLFWAGIGSKPSSAQAGARERDRHSGSGARS
jgi:S-adenosyl methyltransferase